MVVFIDQNDEDVDDIEDYVRIEFRNELDYDTVYKSIRCIELIGNMTDISEDERSQMLEKVEYAMMCPDIETMEIGEYDTFSMAIFSKLEDEQDLGL